MSDDTTTPDAGDSAEWIEATGDLDPLPDPVVEVETDPEPGDIEARKYRKRAQAAEADRDALRTRLESAQRAQVLSLATDLAEPADVFSEPLGGQDLDALLDDDGLVDTGKVRAAVDTVLRSRPGLARNYASTHQFADTGQGRSANTHSRRTGPSWADLLSNQ